jgi:hypothetical protein
MIAALDSREVCIMTNWKKNAKTREAILALLDDNEIAKVSRAEGDARWIEGDEYVDLENLAAGVQQEHGTPWATPRGLIPRSSVSQGTWTKIINAL